ncbi:hypothetical protein GGR56DRAFT_73242 [Xylariaceae sp. FL0804]|nr:hypothetical protein GGR56DRAFT_73242 [Xylariaceae sp. FL0804]
MTSPAATVPLIPAANQRGSRPAEAGTHSAFPAITGTVVTSRSSSVATAASPLSSASPPSIGSGGTHLSTDRSAIMPAHSAHPLSNVSAMTAANATVSKGSITSKEWVIPPRPKPGRKPATDTPPTKRKAQNRAAQRAFRERRAARVGELEEQLEEKREEHDRAQQDLQNQVQGLEAEVQSLRSRCVSLEDMLEKERAERLRIASELESVRRPWRGEGHVPSLSSRSEDFTMGHQRAPSMASQPPLPRGSLVSNTTDHRSSTTGFSIAQIVSPPHTSSTSDHSQLSTTDPAGCGNCDSNGPCACVDEVLSSTAVGCGDCSVGTRCACLEAALGAVAGGPESDLKRKSSAISAAAPEEKRQKPEHYPNETDFTSMFSSRKRAPPAQIAIPPPQQAIPPRDSCGFCSEGTYCMCAEAAASQTLAPLGAQVQTPPPSEGDVGPPPLEVTSTGAVKLPSIDSLNRTSGQSNRQPAGGCGANGPGTCQQCLGDAKSGLFCRSLAANFARETGQPGGGCCGGSGASGGCCQSGAASVPVPVPNPAEPGLGLSLSCADAYKTLSSHRNFDRAADEIGTWLPKLKAVPREPSTSSRLPIEVETASIMGVLKEFDVRFGRDA